MRTSEMIHAEWVAAKEFADAANARVNELKEELVASLPEVKGTTKFPTGSVTLAELNSYNGDAFMALLSDGQIQRVTSRTLDRKKAAANYPELWESVKETNGWRVTIK